jgi:hypothetical protein
VTRPIPRFPEPQGVPVPLSEVVLPPTDDAGSYVPTKREPQGWYVRTLRAVHRELVELEANERTRFIVIKTMLLPAEPEERDLFVLDMAVSYDPAVEAALAELPEGRHEL